jgi:hypothetical protein
MVEGGEVSLYVMIRKKDDVCSENVSRYTSASLKYLL